MACCRAAVNLPAGWKVGGRRLPMSANYCALTIEAVEGDKVVVQLDTRDSAKDVVAVRALEKAPANREAKI